MRFHIEFARRTRIFDRRLGREIPFRTYSRIVAALAGSERPLSRTEVIDLVWPGTPLSAARNRFRVALVALRKLLPEAVSESADGLFFNPEVVEVDLWQIAAEIRSAEDTVTRATEKEALAQALSPLGDGTAFAAFRLVAEAFSAQVVEAACRLVELSLVQGDANLAIDTAVLAIALGPDSAPAWAGYLRAARAIGRSEEATSRLRRNAPGAVQESPSVLEAVRAGRGATASAQGALTEAERTVVAEIFERLEHSRPDLWRAVLSSPESLLLAGKYPRQMHDLLERATPRNPAEPATVWERSAGRLIGLKAWLSDAEGVLAAAPAVLETSKDPTIQRAVWNAVAMAYATLRRWEEAEDALAKTAKFAARSPNPMDAISAQGNGAFFRMHEGRFEEASSEYGRVQEQLSAVDTDQARFELAICVGNKSLIPVYQARWQEAREQIESAIQARSQPGLNVQMGLLETALGLAEAKLGEFSRAPARIRAGFVDAFAADSIPMLQATFEFAAGALSATNHSGYALALLQWVDAWRARTDTPRSKAEADLCDRFVPTPPAHVPVIEPEAIPTTVGREAVRRLRLYANRSQG